MEIVSIIVINEGIVESIDSFHMNHKEDVSSAESLFKETIRGEDSRISNEDLEVCIEDGYYQNGDRSVCLAWSKIE